MDCRLSKITIQIVLKQPKIFLAQRFHIRFYSLHIRFDRSNDKHRLKSASHDALPVTPPDNDSQAAATKDRDGPPPAKKRCQSKSPSKVTLSAISQEAIPEAAATKHDASGSAEGKKKVTPEVILPVPDATNLATGSSKPNKGQNGVQGGSAEGKKKGTKSKFPLDVLQYVPGGVLPAVAPSTLIGNIPAAAMKVHTVSQRAKNRHQLKPPLQYAVSVSPQHGPPPSTSTNQGASVPITNQEDVDYREYLNSEEKIFNWHCMLLLWWYVHGRRQVGGIKPRLYGRNVVNYKTIKKYMVVYWEILVWCIENVKYPPVPETMEKGLYFFTKRDNSSLRQSGEYAGVMKQFLDDLTAKPELRPKQVECLESLHNDQLEFVPWNLPPNVQMLKARAWYSHGWLGGKSDNEVPVKSVLLDTENEPESNTLLPHDDDGKWSEDKGNKSDEGKMDKNGRQKNSIETGNNDSKYNFQPTVDGKPSHNRNMKLPPTNQTQPLAKNSNNKKLKNKLNPLDPEIVYPTYQIGEAVYVGDKSQSGLVYDYLSKPYKGYDAYPSCQLLFPADDGNVAPLREQDCPIYTISGLVQFYREEPGKDEAGEGAGNKVKGQSGEARYNSNENSLSHSSSDSSTSKNEKNLESGKAQRNNKRNLSSSHSSADSSTSVNENNLEYNPEDNYTDDDNEDEDY
eukprot:jgi/Psemu1/20378/gm1.20378_g